MTPRTKVFSLLVLVLLFLPVVFNPQRSGEVLGTNESATSTSQSETTANQSGFFGNFTQPKTSSQPIPAESEIVAKTQSIGDIASGVRSVKDSTAIETVSTYTGKAIVNMNTTLDASSDKFPLGTSLKITNGDKEINVVVQGRTVLAGDTLVVLDKETFQKLGGEAAKGSLEVTINLN